MARHRIHSLSFKKQIVQEYAAGEFDPEVEAATLLGDYEARSRPSSGWSAVRRSRSSS